MYINLTSLSSTQHDEIEAALELYEEVVTIYAEAFKETAKKRKKKDKNDHKAYIGAALHNIGILQLLRFDFEEALSFFEKAAENRKDHFGEGSVDHMVRAVLFCRSGYLLLSVVGMLTFLSFSLCRHRSARSHCAITLWMSMKRLIRASNKFLNLARTILLGLLTSCKWPRFSTT